MSYLLLNTYVNYLYLQQTGKQCLDHYVKLKNSESLQLKQKNRIKGDGIEFSGRFLKIKFA